MLLDRDSLDFTYFAPRPAMRERLDAPEATGTLEGFGALAREGSAFWNFADNLFYDGFLNGEDDPTWTPERAAALVKGTVLEGRGGVYLTAPNQHDTEVLIRRAEGEAADRERIGRMSIERQLLHGLVVGLADPINAVPVLGVGYRFASAGARLAAGAAAVGVSAAGTEAINQALLSETQVDFDREGAALAIGGAGIVGAVLGGGISALLGPKIVHDLGRLTDEGLRQSPDPGMEPHNPRGMNVSTGELAAHMRAAGAAAVDDPDAAIIARLQDDGVPMSVIEDIVAGKRAPGFGEGKLSRAFDKTTGYNDYLAKAAPKLRSLYTRASPLVGQYARRLVGSTIRALGGRYGLAADVPVERAVRAWQQLSFDTKRAVEEAYYSAIGASNMAERVAADARNAGSGMTRDAHFTAEKFRVLVSMAAETADGKLPVNWRERWAAWEDMNIPREFGKPFTRTVVPDAYAPHIERAAKRVREMYFDKTTEDAVRVGLITQEAVDRVKQKNGAWVTHIWLKQKLKDPAVREHVLQRIMKHNQQEQTATVHMVDATRKHADELEQDVAAAVAETHGDLAALVTEFSYGTRNDDGTVTENVGIRGMTPEGLLPDRAVTPRQRVQRLIREIHRMVDDDDLELAGPDAVAIENLQARMRGPATDQTRITDDDVHEVATIFSAVRSRYEPIRQETLDADIARAMELSNDAPRSLSEDAEHAMWSARRMLRVAKREVSKTTDKLRTQRTVLKEQRKAERAAASTLVRHLGSMSKRGWPLSTEGLKHAEQKLTRLRQASERLALWHAKERDAVKHRAAVYAGLPDDVDDPMGLRSVRAANAAVDRARGRIEVLNSIIKRDATALQPADQAASAEMQRLDELLEAQPGAVGREQGGIRMAKLLQDFNDATATTKQRMADIGDDIDEVTARADRVEAAYKRAQQTARELATDMRKAEREAKRTAMMYDYWFTGEAEQRLRRMLSEMADDTPIGYHVFPAAERGAVKHRFFELPVEVIEPALIRDVNLLIESLQNRFVPDLELTRAIGDASGRKMVRDIHAWYQAALTRDPLGKSPNSGLDLASDMREGIADMLHMIAEIRHTLHADGNSIENRAVRALSSWSAATYLGQIVVASMPDIASIVGRYGLFAPVRGAFDTLVPLMTRDGREMLKQSREFIQAYGVANQLEADLRLTTYTDVNNVAFNETWFEKGLIMARRGMGRLFGISYWNQFWQLVSARLTTQYALRAIERVATSATPDPADLDWLATMYIGVDDARRIWAAGRDVIERPVAGPWLPNAAEWRENGDVPHDLVRKFGHGVALLTDNTILMPGVGSVPRWFDKHGLMPLFAVFQRFQAAMVEQLIERSQRLHARDGAVLLGLATGVGIGTMTYYLRTPSDRWSDDPLEVFLHGVDRSGLVPWLGSINNTMYHMTGLGWQRAFREPTPFELRTPGRPESIAAPIALASDAVRAVASTVNVVLDDDLTDAEYDQWRWRLDRITPLLGAQHIRWSLDQLTPD